MKRGITIFIALVLGITSVVLADSRERKVDILQMRAPASGSALTRDLTGSLDEILYFQDWESGTLDDWVPYDLTATAASWHLDSWNAFGGSGTSWWVGDPEVGSGAGGYLSDWYMTLNSPSVNLGANPGMIFWQRYNTEAPGGEPTGYDSWDGVNIRISTNGGTSWEVIETVTPAYNAQSSYAFGFQHGEGPGIPQWCNRTSGLTWHQVTADLSQWANQTVMLRWAFASDPEFDTGSNGAGDMFGWQVDNIRVYSGTDTLLSHDADAAEGFVGATQVPVGGNLWRIAQDATSPHGPNVVVCNNEGTATYNANMNTELVGPNLDISELGTNGLLIADVQVTGQLSDEDCADDLSCDHWGIEVSMDGGESWCAVSNPACGDILPNYVYVDCPTTWSSFNDSYSTPMDFSQFIILPEPPQSLRFKLTFETTEYEDSLGYGPKFDGFILDFQAGFPNDVRCYTLQVKYPTMVNRPIGVTAYFDNPGGLAQGAVPAWFRITGQTQQRFLPNLSLQPGERDTRDTVLTITTASDIELRAWPALSTDQDQSNDTTACPPLLGPDDGVNYPIHVQGASEDLELGYDNRHVRSRYIYASGEGPMVRFTPEADKVSAVNHINSVLASFDAGQEGTQPIRFHVYADNEGAPGTELFNQEIQVAASETGVDNWKTVDVSGEATTRYVAGDFWVWLETLNTGAEPYPQILGNTAEPWDADDHAYSWDGSGSPDVTDRAYQIHAAVVPIQITLTSPNTSAPVHLEDTVPVTWTVENFTENVDIHLNRSYPTGDWELIAEDIANSGSYDWVVAGDEATAARIRIQGTEHTTVFDESDVNFRIDQSIDAEDANPGVPKAWSLSRNFPNPFNPTTEIQYSVPRAQNLTLKVYNLVGQEVATLVDGHMDAGVHTVQFDGQGLASGVYVYHLETSGFTASHKMLLLK